MTVDMPGESMMTDNGHFLEVPMSASTEKHIASIELSNACREFYKTRSKETELAKQRLMAGTERDSEESNCQSRKKRSSIDIAMETLRTATTSLMDQNLSLMRTLLNLNETIEDLKSQRWYRSSRSSMMSSVDIHNSQESVSDTDMFQESDHEGTSKYPILSELSTSASKCRLNKKTVSDHTHCAIDDLKNTSSGKIHRCMTSDHLFDDQPLLSYHGEQSSFDSGIHETDFS